MTVTPEMIARAKRCDCAKCKKYLKELEDAYRKSMSFEQTLKSFFKRFS